MVAPPLTVSAVRAVSRGRTVLLTSTWLVLAVVSGLMAAYLALSGRSGAILAMVFVLLPIAVWRFPESGVMVMAFTAITIEQFPLALADWTDRLPIFRSLSASAGFSGIYVNPAEVIMATILLTWVAKAIATRSLRIIRSQLALAFLLFLVIVVIGEIHGLSRGGDFKASLWEVRPLAYLVLLYFLAAQLITHRQLIWFLLWAVVIGSGIKGIQGTLGSVMVGSVYPRPQSILEHEEAVFFGCYILLAAGLWLFGVRGRLRGVATCLLPFVLFANLANNRRTAWLILGAGFAVMLLIAWISLPQRRRLVSALAVMTLTISAVYFPIFWNSQSVFAKPAQAVRSAFAPDPRDASSNYYRVVENANLGINVRQYPLGAGFGLPIENPIPIADVARFDPTIALIPHNTILYIWWRLGLPGALAFWFLVGCAVVATCQLARSSDPRMALFGAVVACALIAYLLEGWFDQGLSSFRIPILVGCLIGSVEAARSTMQSAQLSSAG
jgi:hypothetical protein